MDGLEALLLEWAQWLNVGDGSGYSTMSVLHQDWSPPTPGITPTLKTSPASRVRELHRCIGMLSIRLANTMVVVYCQQLPPVEQARRLHCSESTVRSRVIHAKRRLLAQLNGQ